MKQEPRVSIITVTLNRDSLAQACKSVDEQSYKNWHHYVIGDGVLPSDFYSNKRSSFGFSRSLGAEEPGLNMPDGTPNPIQRWALKNLDLNEYVCFLDDDNCYLPNFLEEMILALEAKPNVGVALCQVSDLRHKQNIDGFPEVSRCDNSGVLYRNKVVKKIEFPYASMEKNVIQDCEYIKLCSEIFGWITVPKTLVIFGSSPNVPTPRGQIKLLESWEEPLIAHRLILNGDFELGIQKLQRAILLDPYDGWSLWALAEAYLFQGDQINFTQALNKWYVLANLATKIENHWIECSKGIAVYILKPANYQEKYNLFLARSIDLVRREMLDDPESQYLIFSYGIYNALSNKIDLAQDQYIKALKQNARDFAYYNAKWKIQVLSEIPEFSLMVKGLSKFFN